MSEWRSLHAYTALVDRMLLEVVGPFFERHQGSLRHGFWERHYVGGPHIRIRVQPKRERAISVVRELSSRTEAWLNDNPSQLAGEYSAKRAAALLRSEGVDPSAEDLSYRNGVVLERSYPEPGKRYATEAARELMEDFRKARGPIALRILDDDAGRREAAFRLFLALALHIGHGNYPPGAVSYKSHWEGFAATFNNDELLERVGKDYAGRRDRLLEIADGVAQQSVTAYAGDPLVGSWIEVVRTFAHSVTGIFESGQELIGHPDSIEDAVAMRDRLFKFHVRRRSDFVETLWNNEEFFVLIKQSASFQRPRALVNLLYDVVAAAGLSPIDKMVLCHHTFRTIEEQCECDLNVLLRRNIQTVLKEYGYPGGLE